MDVLMVAAELSPYAAQTPAAETIASLAKTLRQMGHNVTLALARHPGFAAQGLLAARRLTPLTLPGSEEVTVFDGQLACGAHLVLFDAPELFDRPGVYGEGGEDYSDNAARFGRLSQAAVALVRERARQGQRFDVVHLHDWPAALVALALAQDPDVSLPTALTIHDVTRQGSFASKELDGLGLSSEPAVTDCVKLGSQLNLLKAGVECADALTTVSTSYAKELGTEARSGELAPVIAGCDRPVIGIENGIDYAIYNPATDAALVSHYSAEDVSNKGRSKTALILELGLELDPERPLVVAGGRLSKGNGHELLAEAALGLLKSQVTLVVAGNGEADLKRKFAAVKKRYAETFAVLEAPDETTLRRMYAAADLVIAPARHEPCDPVPLIAQRYGALPVARASGGTQDTVVDCDAPLETGTGFLYQDDSSQALLAAVQRGLAAYVSSAWPRLRRRVMRRDLGWDRPTRRYLQVYRQAITARS